MAYAAITGWGLAVPEGAVTNADLRQAIPVDEEWIVRRTGIRERRLAGDAVATSDLAAAAGERALRRAGVDAADLDLVVVATCTPDRLVPATAPLVQAALGARGAGAFDVNAACAGFVTALSVCSALIQAGMHSRALVVGAEVLSRFVDWEDPKTCVLFGDGAGAVVLEPSETPAGMLSSVSGADGSAADLIEIHAGGSAMPASPATVAERWHFLRMNGPEVYRAAVRIMVGAAAEAIAAARLQAEDIDLFVCHQANQRIIDEVGARLGLAPERVFSNVARYGNTSAASVPIALCEAAEQGLLAPGSTVVLSAVGAGLTWTAGVVRWTGARAEREIVVDELVGLRA